MDGDFEFVSCILHSSFHSVVRLIKKEKKNLDRRRGRGELESHVYFYSCFLFVFLSSSSSKEIASWAIWTITLFSFLTPDTSFSCAIATAHIPGSPFLFLFVSGLFHSGCSEFWSARRGYRRCVWREVISIFPFEQFFLDCTRRTIPDKCRTLCSCTSALQALLEFWRVWKRISHSLVSAGDRLKTSFSDLWIIA